MTKEQWEELKTLPLRQWLAKNHPSVLGVWEESITDLLIDLDIWLEEYHGMIDQEYQAYVKGKQNE